MKTTHSFYYMCLIIIGLNFLMYCGGNDNNNKGEMNTADSTGLTHEDTLSANLRDPVSAYPYPPVTGTQTDSGYIKDSSGKK